ncbi:MAG: phytanoyl-CoA dioxygenase family protein [Gammaproteobacteria bacterium]|nr:phytanoyl-CoA dioxygenase family protein [Gammaproteobacteria bacterium]
MGQQQEFRERPVTFERPNHHFAFLVAHDGTMLGLDDDGALALYDEADDRVIWDRTPGGVRHVATGKAFAAEIARDTCALPVNSDEAVVTISRGPEKLPSEYLEHLKREGWVCLTCILSPDIVDGLQRVAGSDRHEGVPTTRDMPMVCQHSAVGRAICEPVSLWLIRQYVGTRNLHLGHPPNCNSLAPWDGKRPVQGWHSDIPYIPSVGGNVVADRKGPIKAVQRNVCISDFSKRNGATAYKLGSHLADTLPPPEWNPGRHGPDPAARPYSGPDADVIEAPAGSIVLYDARTWHRAGFNHSDRKRAAMLMSFQTADVKPKRDTRPVCGRLHESPVYRELDARQQREITELMMNQPGDDPHGQP